MCRASSNITIVRSSRDEIDLYRSGLALVIYILWQLAVQGNLPRTEFAPVIAKGGDVSALLEALHKYIEVEYIAVVLNFLLIWLLRLHS